MARQRWELENQIVATDDPITTAAASSPDQIYWYDEAANARAQQEKAWTADHNYFKRVKVTTTLLFVLSFYQLIICYYIFNFLLVKCK
jgi:COP9 signalosome complex subunit 5